MKTNFNHKGFFQKEAEIMREKILNTPNTEEIYEIKGTKYYISNNGCDCNDGLSPETAIKSLDAIDLLPLKDGDALLFERGSTFRFTTQLNTVNGVIYGSYGEGEKPNLYGSWRNYAKSIWKQTSNPNIWESNCYNERIGGIIFDDGEYVGVYKWKLEDLTENEHFFFNKYYKKIYIYCDRGNPSDIFSSIEIISNIMGLSMSENDHDNVFDNLCFKYFFFPTYSYGKNHGITFTNCVSGWVGGCEGGPVRLGNAFSTWNGGADFTVENCWIYQTFDSAISWQGYCKKNNMRYDYKNINYSHNLFEYNNCDIEFFDREDATLENFKMEGNLMRFTSMGWGTTTVEGKIRGIEGCIRAHTDGMDSVKSTTFTDNILDCPARQVINWDVDPWQWEGIHANGTKIYIKESYRTLENCLQGLQTEEGQPIARRFAKNYDELVEGIKIFDKNAYVHWEK